MPYTVLCERLKKGRIFHHHRTIAIERQSKATVALVRLFLERVCKVGRVSSSLASAEFFTVQARGLSLHKFVREVYPEAALIFIVAQHAQHRCSSTVHSL
jgi:hypothetical protein